MKAIHFLIVTAVILAGALSLCFSQQQPAGASERAGRPSARPTFIKMVGFHLRDGELVVGRQISEDRNSITVEKRQASKLVVATYSKNDVDARTMNTRKVLKWRYYLDLADYFAGRTWDFQDDPDDFIQAIRCCEKAKQLLLERHSSDSAKVEEIDKKIERLNADRQVWAEQTKSRAELKSFEFEAEVAKRVEKLEQDAGKYNRRIEKGTKDMEENYRKLTREISVLRKDIDAQFDITAGQIDANTALLARIDDYLRWRRNPWGQRPQAEPYGQQQ